MNKSEAVKRWRKKTKERIVESMGGKCVCCGYCKCCEAMDLHHLNPEEKEFGLGSVRASIVSWDRIVIELRKCILVCSNCHREIHAGIAKIPKNFAKFDETYVKYRELEKKTTFCPVCGNKKNNINITCSRSCAAKRSRRVEWENINLKEMLKKYSYVKIGEILGVSDSAVRKRCIKMNLI